MDQEGQMPDGENQEGQAEQEGDLQQTFDREYVVKLRNESAKYRTTAQDYKKKALELEKQIKESEEQKLAEQEKWRELAESRQQELDEISAYRERYENVLTSISESNERRIELIPQDMRSLVPNIEPTELARWLDANEGFLKRPAAPDLSASAGNNDRPGQKVTLSDEELAIARKLNISEEDYKKSKR